MDALAGRQLRIGQALRLQQLEERVPEQIRIAVVVVPETDFGEVGRQMLGAELVVGADDGAPARSPRIHPASG